MEEDRVLDDMILEVEKVLKKYSDKEKENYERIKKLKEKRDLE